MNPGPFCEYERIAVERGYSVTPEGQVMNPRGRSLAGHSKHGYLHFRPGKGTQEVAVHRLQGFQLYGERIYTPNLEVRHKDNNSFNNRADNILLGTRHENAMDKPADVRMGAALKAAAKSRKHDHQAVIHFYQSCHSMKKTARHFRTSQSTIHFIVRRSLASQSLSPLVGLHMPAVSQSFSPPTN